MSGGQTLLAIGGLILLMNITMSINRSQMSSLTDTFDHQLTLDAVNYGQSVIEVILYSVREYSELESLYQNYSDVTDPNSRLPYEASFGDTLYAVIGLSEETLLINNISGRHVSVFVYKKEKNDYLLLVEYRASVNSIW